MTKRYGPSKFVEKLIGLYDGDCVRLSLHNRDMLQSDKALYGFFKHFAASRHIEDFGASEVDYYIKQREKAGDSSVTIENDLEYLRAFWNYLIDFHGFEIPNPASRRELSDWARSRLEHPENYQKSRIAAQRAGQVLEAGEVS